MPTVPSSNIADLNYELHYEAEVLEQALFSAVFVAIQYRKATEGLTQSQLGARCDKDKTQISKLLAGPSNWTLKTVSDLAYALGVEVEISLSDKADKSLHFRPSGLHRQKRQVWPSVINMIATGNDGFSSQESPPIGYVKRLNAKPYARVPKIEIPQISQETAARGEI
jgi:transcriptional regulator with XRE-family HTH domain